MSSDEGATLKLAEHGGEVFPLQGVRHPVGTAIDRVKNSPNLFGREYGAGISDRLAIQGVPIVRRERQPWVVVLEVERDDGAVSHQSVQPAIVGAHLAKDPRERRVAAIRRVLVECLDETDQSLNPRIRLSPSRFLSSDRSGALYDS